MDQTTLSQYFVARKSSISTTLPPAKRVRLDSTAKNEIKEQVKRTAVVVKDATKRRSSAKTRSKSKSTASSKGAKVQSMALKPEEKIFNLFKAMPLDGKAVEPVGQMKINEKGNATFIHIVNNFVTSRWKFSFHPVFE